MLSSPRHAVAGCTDLEETERFLANFGLDGQPAPELSAAAAAALYGLDGPAASVCTPMSSIMARILPWWTPHIT